VHLLKSVCALTVDRRAYHEGMTAPTARRSDEELAALCEEAGTLLAAGRIKRFPDRAAFLAHLERGDTFDGLIELPPPETVL
jgi:hypothetical protein